MRSTDLPLFSLLIANYNNGQYLHDAIHSVKNQTYSNWEVILVDDGSTDLSHEIYKELVSDPRIKIFYNDVNRGCGYTKNRCVAEAKGEICAFLDPDDALASDALELMVDAHTSFPKSSIVYSSHYSCDAQLKIRGINESVGQVNRLLFGSSKTICALAAFKKSCYDICEPINIDLKRAVDQDLYYKLSEVGDLTYIDKPLYYYRRHDNGISSFGNALKAKYWHAVVVQNTCQRRLEKGIPVISKKEQEKYFYDYFIWKAMEKRQNQQYCKALFCVFQSFKLKPFDDIKLKMKLMLPFSKF